MKDKLRELIGIIADWEFPETGKTWPSGNPVSYEANFGSLGVRDYIRGIATKALAILDAEGDGGALSGEVVGSLTISRYRGCDSMVNHDFDYYGNLKDGTYNLYTHPARSGVVSDEDVATACRKYYNCGHPVYPPVFEGMRAALESYERSRK